MSCLFKVHSYRSERWNDLIICFHARTKKHSHLLEWEQCKSEPVFGIGKSWLSENTRQNFTAKGTRPLGDKLAARLCFVGEEPGAQERQDRKGGNPARGLLPPFISSFIIYTRVAFSSLFLCLITYKTWPSQKPLTESVASFLIFFVQRCIIIVITTILLLFIIPLYFYVFHTCVCSVPTNTMKIFFVRRL